MEYLINIQYLLLDESSVFPKYEYPSSLPNILFIGTFACEKLNLFKIFSYNFLELLSSSFVIQ